MEKPLFWYQGLFLQPQHFQTNDRLMDSRFTPYHTHIKPSLTGVVSMTLAENALSRHSFEIIRGEFWFPDMTYLVLGENAVVQSRDFRSHLNPGEPITVYLGLKAWKQEQPNVTASPQTRENPVVDTRFVTSDEAEQVADLYQEGEPAEIRRMVYALRLFFQDELSHVTGYDLIPLARLISRDSGPVLAPEYIPPCVTAGSSPVLLKTILSIGDAITACALELGSFKHKRSIHGAESGTRNMTSLLVLMALNRVVPFFQQVRKEPGAYHPRDVYAVIRQTFAELSSFSGRINVFGLAEGSIQEPGPSETLPEPSKAGGPSGLPPYHHEDLWTCFSRAEILLRDLLAEITAGPDHILDLTFTDPYYTCAMPENLFKGNPRYYLVIRTDQDPKSVLSAIDTSIKVASSGQMKIIVERSLPGAFVEYLPAPPEELPRRNQGIYFRLASQGEMFDHIREEGRLALFWYDPPEDLKMELMVIKGD